MMMSEHATYGRWRPTATNLIAGTLVIAGFLLCGVTWWFLTLTALGTFGPGILRELGWLRDKDEFQQRAAHRAGYHAFLVTGLAAFILVAYFRSSERVLDHLEELATLLLALLWFTWFLSSLLAYWGARKTAMRILIAFGAVWLAFAILSNVGSEWTGWAALLLHPLIALPFFALAWVTSHWPRIAGVLLLGVSAFLAQWLFLPNMLEPGNTNQINDAITMLLLVGPLFASGVALLAAGRPIDEADDDEHDADADGMHESTDE